MYANLRFAGVNVKHLSSSVSHTPVCRTTGQLTEVYSVFGGASLGAFSVIVETLPATGFFVGEALLGARRSILTFSDYAC